MKNLSKQKKEQPIIFVGQSVGGAIATLATICFLDKRLRNIYPLCITFGSPLVGNAALGESIGYQDWSGRFCHVVSKHDVVPRMFLAPFESIALHLISIFPQKKSTVGKSIVGNDTDPLQACTKLVENIKCLGASSSYKPFGIYMSCSTKGAACVEDSQAVLEMLILTLQSIEEKGIAEDRDIARALISEHTSYTSLLKHVIESGYSTRTSTIYSESSIDMGIALQLEAMGFQTQNKFAFDALKRDKNLRNQHDMEVEKLNVELSKQQSKMAELEWYIKTVCENEQLMDALAINNML